MYADIAYCMEVPQASSWDEDYNNATPLHDQDLCWISSLEKAIVP